jgi:anthranilate synthase/aminodeoxychorismate synthase-like glutamine amidotransferase
VVLVIDNYDSFTYNLVQYLWELGAEVVVRRNDEASVAQLETLRPERILLSPGPCTPNEAGVCLDVIRHFVGKLPIFGVCLGHQAIGAAFGGKVVRAKTLMHGKTSAIEHDGKSLFRELPSPFIATRYHSLVVDPLTLPDLLQPTAYATDAGSDRVLMGLRHKTFPIEGVQFHPESVLTPHGKQIVKNFLAM